MVAIHSSVNREEEFLARVTDIAYQAILERGLPGSFLDAELALWERIRAAYRAGPAGGEWVAGGGE
jgi:hypothetical protein